MQDFIERFRAALRIRTDWPAGARPGDTSASAEAALTGFQDFLAGTYPAFHQCAQRTVLSPYSVAYCWLRDKSPRDKTELPVMLTGHYDVVPAETAKWSVDPFGAEIKNGFIYGRGALDMKNIVMEIMEAADDLCRQGFRPARDVWFVFGGDEERTGLKGAQETAKWFAKKGINFSFILDEGTPVAVDQIKGISRPLALIGIEEKGYLSLDITVEQKPGHASQPPDEQAAAVLARALIRISKRPFPWFLTPGVEAFFAELGNYAPGITGFVMKHARLLGPLFFKAAGTSPSTRALLRNTIAMTQLEGSAADNVMPSAVRAVINLRLLPPWTIDQAIGHIKKSAADPRVSVTVHGCGSDPMGSAPGQAAQTSPGWKEIKAALAGSFADAPALPFLMPATTDSRHYRELTQCIYRFCPQLLNPAELSAVHGHDERVSVDNLEKGLKFYTELLRQF